MWALDPMLWFYVYFIFGFIVLANFVSAPIVGVIIITSIKKRKKKGKVNS